MENYQKSQATGASFAIPVDGVGVGVKTLTAAGALTAADSGKLIVLKAAVGAAVTLPAVQAGLKYKIVVGQAFATTAWTITAPAKVIQGTVIVNGESVLGENEDIITFAHAAEKVGDFVDLVCDGTNWYVSGIGSAGSSITLTASA